MVKLSRGLAADASRHNETALAEGLSAAADGTSAKLETGALRYPKKSNPEGATDFQKWVRDTEVTVWLNHETRSHMTSDLGRYLYAAVFAEQRGYSPKGHKEFALKGLAPEHANWESGKFADRFRVQLNNLPSTTVTSHISKDGHYFIHPDPTQCRSLTVREVASLTNISRQLLLSGQQNATISSSR